MNLVLGTAALGFPYGAMNRTGKLSQIQATKIVEKAWECGIREFDTAQIYQDSEIFLGQAFTDLGIRDCIRVITKLDPKINPLDERKVIQSVAASMHRLRSRGLHGVLLHREYLLDMWHRGLSEILLGLISGGWTEKVGISVYLPERALQALSLEGFDIVQFPGNVLDRRVENANVFELALQRNKEIYLRNIFLQGLLLMKPESIPERFSFIKRELEKLNVLLKENDLTAQELLIGYLKNSFPSAKLIFGAETPEQVEENVEAWNKRIPFGLLDEIKKVFSNVDEKKLIPKMWPK